MVTARGPGNLGTAHGNVTIGHNFNQLEAASRRAGRNVSRNMDRMSDSARRTEQSLARLRRVGTELAGALGVTFGIAGAIGLARLAVRSAEAETAFRRQEVAARSLAGSQKNLNRLLDAYEDATRGAIGRAESLADVTRLQATGFADTTSELERFVRASRGAALATGRDLEYITQQIQLTIANQSTMRLDQIGLGVGEVQKRTEELQSSTGDLTRELAFQEAVLSLLIDKYGEAADALEPTSLEQTRVAFDDLRLAIGGLNNEVAGFTPAGQLPEAINGLTTAIQTATGWIDTASDNFGQLREESELVAGAIREIGEVLTLAIPTVGPFANIIRQLREIQQLTRALGRGAVAGGGSGGFGDEGTGVVDSDGTGDGFSLTPLQSAAMDWAQERERIETETGDRINEVTREYNQQRADTISDFEQQIARDAADFARQRRRQEADLARRIADVHEERARREAQAAEDLAQRIADAQTESAERIADWERDRNERVANVRSESNDRLQDLEEDYAREREQALRDHRNNILSAAGRLDARALHEEQRRFAAQEQNAAESHEERISDEREAEQERIHEINEMHRERVAQERETLDETIRQAKDAHQERLQDAREADRRRVEDMRESFELQKAREDEDRAIRLQRLKQDHNDQLDEQDRQHGLRIDQIERQGQEERTALDLEFQEQLIDLKGQSKQLLQHQKDLRDDAMELFDEFWEHVNETIGPQEAFPSLADPRPRGFAHGGAVNSTGLAMLHAGEYVLNPGITSQLRNMLGGISQPGLVGAVAGGGRNVSVSMAEGAIQVNAAPGQSAGDVSLAVRAELVQFFQEMAE